MKEIKSFFESTVNLITMGISLIPSFLLWVFPPNVNVPSWIFIAITILCFILIWLLTLVLITKSKTKSQEDIIILSCNQSICLCSPNKLLTHESIVSIYFLDSGYENLIAYGIVNNIQGDGRVQIEPHKLPDTVISEQTTSIIDFLKVNRDKVVIKPVITRKIISNFQQY